MDITKVTLRPVAMNKVVAIASIVIDDSFVVPGALMLSLGVGFLASSLISGRLARSWGMLGRADGEGESIR